MFDYSRWFPIIKKALDSDDPIQLRWALLTRSHDLLEIANARCTEFQASLSCPVDIYNFDDCKAAIGLLNPVAQAAAWQLYAAYCHAFEMFITADCDARILIAKLPTPDYLTDSEDNAK